MKALRVASDELEIELLPELGGRWHRLRAFGADLLRTPDELDAYRREPFFWGSFVMAPWCNRMAAGAQHVAGRSVDLPANFPDGTAIHGQVQALAWEVAAPGMLRVTAGGHGWPWRYEVTQRLDVAGRRLRLHLEVVNRSTEAMPAGIGVHPWFRQPIELTIAADRVFTSNEASPPEPVPVGAEHDLRTPRPMPPELDATWAGLRGPEVAEIRWPELGISASMRTSPEGAYLCAASPAALAAVAIEPQTHAPDGLRRLLNAEPGGLRWLEPRLTLHLAIEIEFREA